MWSTAREYVADVGRDLLGGWLAKTCGSTLLAVICGWIGGRDKLVEGLFLIICLDFVLGFTRGWVDGCLSRAKFRRGLAKFFLYYAAILASCLLDDVLNVKAAEVLLHVDFRALMVMYLAINETISVLGHLRSFGVPLPEKMIRRLKDYRDCAVFNGRPGKGA